MEKEGLLDLDLLITMVKCKSFLYDKRDRQYKDLNLKEMAWKEIAAALNSTPSCCETLWKRLKEKYTRERKKAQKLVNAGGVTDYPKWTWYTDMEFVDEFIPQRRRNEFTSMLRYSSLESPLPCSSDFESTEVAGSDDSDTVHPNLECSVKEEAIHHHAHNDSRSNDLPTTSSKSVVLNKNQDIFGRLLTDKVSSSETVNLKKIDTFSSADKHKTAEMTFGELVAKELSQIEDTAKRRNKKRKIMEILYSDS